MKQAENKLLFTLSITEKIEPIIYGITEISDCYNYLGCLYSNAPIPYDVLVYRSTLVYLKEAGNIRATLI